jgi:hypothetical protein
MTRALAALLSRSSSARPLLPLALLLLLAARGVLPLSVAPLMNGSARVAACYAHGDIFSRPDGLEPHFGPHYRAGAHFGPPTVPAFRPQAEGAVTESGCVRRPQVSNSDERPRLETPPLLQYSSVLAKASSSPLSLNSFYCLCCFTLCYSAADNNNLMTPAKPPKVFLRRAQEKKGLEENSVGIDGTKVYRRLDPETERRCDATMALWTA